MSGKGGHGPREGAHSSTCCSVNKAKNDAILAWLQLRLSAGPEREKWASRVGRTDAGSL